MGKIVLLDDLTINQIAAGEVIERPASVIKEMVENSIDAGAKNITVEIKNGGISLIRITDDGSGIAADDMEIAFERHATSKIRKAEDLEVVQTMGFRGEALASIAAISKVEVVSKTADDEVGHKLVIEGGKTLEKEEVASQKGTRITVQNLFYNTPVRYKFLKKDYTEAGYVETVVTRIALINRDVAIKLINNDKVLLQTNGSGDLKNIVYSIYGRDVAENIIDIDYTFEDMQITGVIGKPSIARSNRSNQMFFVNNRYIKDAKLSVAAEQAYREVLSYGKYGFLILNIKMDPKKVDVNVHPAKLEVRFEEEQEVFRAIYNAIKSGLASIVVAPKFEFNYANQETISTDNATQKIDEKVQNTAIVEQVTETAPVKPEVNEEIPITESVVNKVVEEIKPEIPVTSALNEEIIDKEIKIGNTRISSNTRQLDFNIADALKEATQKLDTTKKIEIQETQIVPVTREIVSQETQTVDLSKELKASENVEGQPVIKVEEIENSENVEDNTKKVLEENIKEDSEVLESTVPSVEAVENITSRILALKMNNMENTQMIDTAKVREAMNEVNEVTPEFANMYKKTFGVDANIIRKEREIEEREKEKINVSNEFVNAENDNLFEKEEVIPARVNYKLIGTAFNTNIIIELNNEMYIIDQNAAFERLAYEAVKANYFSTNGKDSQNLLLPDIITVSYREMSITRENIELFENAGFAFEEFGENTLKLTAVPSICEELNTKQLFINVLNEIDRVALNEKEEKEEKFIIAVAKNATTKINRALDEREIDELLQKLLVLENPFDTTHGSITAIKMSRADIEKKFSRRK